MDKNRILNYFLCVGLLGYFGLMCLSCKKDSSLRKDPEININSSGKDDKVFLKIGDLSFKNSDFKNYLSLILGEDSQDLPQESSSRLLDNYINDQFLIWDARKRGLSLTPEEKKEYLAKMAKEFSIDNQTIHLAERETRPLLEQLLIEKFTFELVKNIEVTNGEVQAYYEEHKRDFLRGERVKVSQILLPTEDKAVEILERVKRGGEKNFREIANKESIGIEAVKGGELGTFEMNQLPVEMEKVIFSLKQGEISPVVESSHGFHIFRVDEKIEPKLLSVEDASSTIMAKILDQKIKIFIAGHIDKLKQSAEWEFYPKNLYFSYQRNIDE